MPPKTLTQAQLEHILRKAGWSERLVPIMSAIGMAESSGNVGAYNPGDGHGGRPTKEQSIGPWQINMLPSLNRPYDRQRLATDPVYNAQVAKEIYSAQGLKAWGAYTDGRYRKYYKGTPLPDEEFNGDTQGDIGPPPQLPPLKIEQVLPQDKLDSVYQNVAQSTDSYAQKLGMRPALSPLIESVPQVSAGDESHNGVKAVPPLNSIKPLPKVGKNVPTAPISQPDTSQPVVDNTQSVENSGVSSKKKRLADDPDEQGLLQARFAELRKTNPSLTVDQFNQILSDEHKVKVEKSKQEWLAKNPALAKFAKEKNLDPFAQETVDEYNTSRKKYSATKSTAKTQFDKASFNQANKFLREQGQPELSREEFIARQEGNSKVGISLDPNTFTVDGTKITDYEIEAPAQGGGTIRFPREVGKGRDANGTVAVYRSEKGMSEEDAYRAALLNAGSRYGVTPEQVNAQIDKLKSAGKKLFQSGKHIAGNMIAVTWDDLANAGVDVNRERRMEQSQNTLVPAVDVGGPQLVTAPGGTRYAVANKDTELPTLGEFVDQILGDRDQQNNLTEQRKKELEYRVGETQEESEAAEFRANVLKSALANNFSLGESEVITGFGLTAASYLSWLGAGGADLTDKIDPFGVLSGSIVTNALFGRSRGDFLGKFGNKVQKLNELSTPDNSVYKIYREVGNVAGALPAYAAVGVAVGGNPVLTFAITDALVAKGKGGSLRDTIGAGAKGAVMGALIGNLSRFGTMAADGLLGESLLKVVPKVKWEKSIDPSVRRAISRIWQADAIVQGGGSEAIAAKKVIERELAKSGLTLEQVLAAKPGAVTGAEATAAANEAAKKLTANTADSITTEIDRLAGRKIARGIIEHGVPIGLATGIGYGVSAIEGGSTQDNLKNALLFGAMQALGSIFHKKKGEKLTPDEVNKADGTVVRVPDEKGKPHDLILLKENNELTVTDVTGKVPPEAIQGAVLPKPPTPAPTDGETLISSTEIDAKDKADATNVKMDFEAPVETKVAQTDTSIKDNDQIKAQERELLKAELNNEKLIPDTIAAIKKEIQSLRDENGEIADIKTFKQLNDLLSNLESLVTVDLFGRPLKEIKRVPKSARTIVNKQREYRRGENDKDLSNTIDKILEVAGRSTEAPKTKENIEVSSQPAPLETETLVSDKVDKGEDVTTRLTAAVRDVVDTIPEGVIGRGALNKVADELTQETDPLKLLTAIQRGRTRIANMPKSPEVAKALTPLFDEIQQALQEQGYEVQDLVGKKFDIGMNLVATFVEDNNVPVGQEIIIEVIKPAIYKDGQQVQAAEVLVGKNYSESTEAKAEREAAEQKAEEEARQRKKKEMFPDLQSSESRTSQTDVTPAISTPVSDVAKDTKATTSRKEKAKKLFPEKDANIQAEIAQPKDETKVPSQPASLEANPLVQDQTVESTVVPKTKKTVTKPVTDEVVETTTEEVVEPPVEAPIESDQSVNDLGVEENLPDNLQLKAPKEVKKPVTATKKPPPLKPTLKPATAEEIHAVAKEKGVDVNSPVFHKLSKDLVGVAKLDHMSPMQLTKVREGIKAGRFDHAKIAKPVEKIKYKENDRVITQNGTFGIVEKLDDDGKHIWIFDPESDKTSKHLISTISSENDPKFHKAMLDMFLAKNENNKNFREFFKGSKAVDFRGNPVIYFHGGFQFEGPAFNARKTSDFGFHFGNRDQANARAKKISSSETGIAFRDTELIPAVIQARRPLRLRDEGHWSNKIVFDQAVHAGALDQSQFKEIFGENAKDDVTFITGDYTYKESEERLKRALEKAGYDSIVYTNEYETDVFNDSFILFRPEQIKSIYNNGNYSSDARFHKAAADKILQLGAEGTSAQWVNRNENTIKDWNKYLKATVKDADALSVRFQDVGLELLSREVDKRFKEKSSAEKIKEVSTVDLTDYLQKMADANAEVNNPDIAAAVAGFRRDPKESTDRINKIIADNRTESLQEWKDYLTKENPVYARDPFFRDWVWTDLIRLRSERPDLPLSLDKAALSAVYADIKEKPNSSAFQKLYEKKVSELMLQDAETSEILKVKDGTWIKIPQTDKTDPKFKEAVAKVQAVSRKEWCTSQGMAETYIQWGDFWVLIKNEKSELAIRFEGGAVAEIQGKENNGSIPEEFLPDVKDLIRSNKVELTISSMDQVLRAIKQSKFNAKKAEFIKERDKLYRKYFDPEYKAPKASKKGDPEVGELNKRINELTEKKELEVDYDQEYKKLREKYGGAVWREAISLVSNTGILPDTAHAEGDITNESLQDIKSRLKKFDWDGYALKRKDTVFRNKILEIAEQYADLRVRDLEDILKNKKSELDKELTPTKDQREKEHQEFLETTVGKYGQAKFTLAKTISDDLAGIPTTSAARDDMSQVELDKYAKNYRIHLTDANTVQTSKNTAIDLHLFESYDKENEAKLREKLKDPEYRKDINEILNLIHDEKLRELEYQFNSKKAELNKELIDKTEVESLSERLLPDSELYKYLEMELPKGTKDWDEAKKRMTDFAGEYYLGSDAWSQEIEDVMYDDLVDELKDRIQKFDPEKYRKQVKEELDRELDDDTELVKHWKSYLSGEIKPDTLHFLRDHYNTNEDGKYHTNSPYDIAKLAIMDGEPTSPLLVLSRNYNLEHWTPARLSKEFDDRATKDSVSRAIRNSYQEVSPALIKTVQSVIERIKNDVIPIFEKDFEAKKAELDRELENDNEPLTFPLTLGPEFTDNFEKIYKETGSGESALRAAVKDFIDKFNSKEKAIEEFSKFSSQGDLEMYLLHDLEAEIYDRAIENLSFNLRPEEKQQLMKSAFNIAGELEEWYINNWEQMESELRGEIDQEINGEDRFQRASVNYQELVRLKSEDLDDKFLAKITSKVDKDGNLEISPAAAELIRRVEMLHTGEDSDPFLGGMLRSNQLKLYIPPLRGILAKAPKEYTKKDLKPLRDLVNNLATAYAKKSAVIYIDKSKVPHEMVHKLRYQFSGFKERVSEYYKTFNKVFSTLEEIEKRAFDNYFRYSYFNGKRFSQLTPADQEFLHEELIAHILDGDYGKLGITDKQAARVISVDTKAYLEKNGDDVIDELQRWIDENQKQSVLEHKSRKNVSKTDKSTKSGRGKSSTRSVKTDETGPGPNPPDDGNPPGVEAEDERDVTPRAYPINAQANTQLNPEDLHFDSQFYTPQSREGNHEIARQWLEERGIANAVNELYDLPVNAITTAKRQAVLSYLDAQVHHFMLQGNTERARAVYDQMVGIANTISPEYTEWGQAISQLAYWQSLDPEAIVNVVENKRARRGKKRGTLDLQTQEKLRADATEIETLNREIDELEDIIRGNSRHIWQGLLRETEKLRYNAIDILRNAFGVTKDTANKILKAIDTLHGTKTIFPSPTYSEKHVASNDGIAFGWGIYSTQSEKVARWYRNPDNDNRAPVKYQGHDLESLRDLAFAPADENGTPDDNWLQYSAAYTIASSMQFGSTLKESVKFWIKEERDGIKYKNERINDLNDHIHYLETDALLNGNVLSQRTRERISDTESQIQLIGTQIDQSLKLIEAYKALKEKDFKRDPLPGAVYKNTIDGEIYHFLRWDLPYNKQSEFIKTRLNEWLSETDTQLKTLSVEAKSASSPNKIEYFGELIQRAITIKKAITEFINAKEGTAGSLGAHFYNSMPSTATAVSHVDRARDKSKLLLSRGILGNSYLIAADRGKESGELNFVNFSAEHIQIVDMFRAAADKRLDISALEPAVRQAALQIGKEKYLAGKVAGGQTLNDWKSSLRNELSQNSIEPTAFEPYMDSLYVAVREEVKTAARAKELERVKKKFGFTDNEKALEKLSQLKAEQAAKLSLEAKNLREAKGIGPRKTLFETALDNEFSNLEGNELEEAKNDIRLVKDRNAFYTYWNKKGLSAKEITARYIDAIDHFININEELKSGQKIRKMEKELNAKISDLTPEEVDAYEKALHDKQKVRNRKMSDFRATIKHLTNRPETPKKRLSDWYLRVNRAGETMLTATLATVSHNIIAQRGVKLLHTFETAGELAILKLENYLGKDLFTKDPTGINIATKFSDMFLEELYSTSFPATRYAWKQYRNKKAGLLAALSLVVSHKQKVIEGVLAHNPDLYEDMYAKYSYGEDVLHKFPIDDSYGPIEAKIERGVRGVESWTHFWTTLNRLQENHFKSATFLGILTVELKARGIDPDEVIVHGKIEGLDRAILEKAVNRAAEDTFSQDIPKTNEAYRAINSLSNFAKWIPFPLNPVLFRRFLFNSTSYMVEHSPLILAKAAGPGVTARDFSKCLVGFGIFSFAVAMLSNFGSDDDDPLTLSFFGTTYKMTAYNPLSSFLILASIVTRAAKGKKPLKAVDEIWKLFGIDTRYPNLALEWFESIADLVSSEEDKKYVKAGELSKQVVGRGISAYFKAFATLKAIHASFDNEEATIRDYGDEPFLAELKKTFPISEATTKLLTGKSSKIREDALTGDPMLKVNPWLDQLGVTVVPEKQIGPKYTAAEEYLDVELSKMRQKNVKFYKTPEQRTASGIVSQLYTALDKGISPETVINRANTYYSKGEISEYQLKNITTTAYIPTKLGRKAIDAPIPMLVRAAKYATKDELNLIKTILEVKAVNQADKNTLTPEELELLRIIFPKL